ncbi:hypothetical protein M0638_02950 [Roseomonas sp. NAR14]|uniref:Uncharacterized protein n=1 Tax=Roseomonas acroporae TaxID=2937791 RepID=A0A9X1Y5C1_9PROT|nr:hypothetical protein [Roseomonas acroporae]MCK8783340.1 hypothetical protein [Roseomonas acroporae]
MPPELRRIVAIEAHRRRSGRCPTVVHSLGNGETFAVLPMPDGFVDLASGLRAQAEADRLLLPGDRGPIALSLAEGDDITFAGIDLATGARFTGRAGGGSSVTLFDGPLENYVQYAVGYGNPDAPEEAGSGVAATAT